MWIASEADTYHIEEDASSGKEVKRKGQLVTTVRSE